MHAVDEEFSVLDGTIGVLQVQRTGTDGLHFRARQLDAGLVFVLHEVVVESLAVLGRDLDPPFLRGAHLISPERFWLLQPFESNVSQSA